MKNRVSNSIYFDSPSSNKIIAGIQSLNVNKAVGHDNIPPYFLKIAALILTPYLYILFDWAFQNGIFPTNCKIAKVISLHKKGDENNPSNYRPISILTCFSKIIEKLIHKRLSNFLDKNNTIVCQKYGFQKGIFTAHVILDIITTSFDNIHNSKYTGIFFLDLQKVFDTVCHKILLAKLDHHGIRGPAHKMIHSFLKRQQYVSFNGINLVLLDNPCGVPQGSTLGPFLFYHI